jgi:HK97 family phage portal protein
MSFIDKQAQAIKASWQPQTLQELDRQIMGGSGIPTATGRFVSEQSALSLLEVQKCAGFLARTEGCLETKVYRWADTARRRKEEAWDHPLYDLLMVAPNNETDAQSFTETQSLFLSLWGNFASIITRNSSRNRNITEIYQWKWWDVQVKRDKETGKLFYEHRDRGKWEPYPAEKVFHINTMSWDGVIGLSTIGMAREHVAQGLAMAEFANRFFGNGMHTNMILESPNVISDTARQNMKAALMEMHAGLAHSWEPFILEEGTKWATVPMNFVDAEFVSMAKLNKLDIDGLFGVPPPAVGNSYEGLTYSNIEQMPLYYVLFTLLPIVTRRERMINWKLLTPQEREAGYFVRTNIRTLLRADAKTRAEYFKNKIQNGAASPNDWRMDDDENPIDDQFGNEYFANGNFRTLKQIVSNDIKSSTSKPNQDGGEKENA